MQARAAQGVFTCGIFVEDLAELGLLYANQQLNIKYSALKGRLMVEAVKDGRTKEVEAGAALGMGCHRLVVSLIAEGLVSLPSSDW